MSLRLHNPHSVLAALQSRPGSVLEVRLGATKASPAWQEVADAAARQRISVSASSGERTAEGRRRQRQGFAEDAGRTAAAEALVREREDVSLEALFALGSVTGVAGEGAPVVSGATPLVPPSEEGEPEKSLSAKSTSFGLWLALDQLQDPHNVGAIFRTAAFFGVRGIVLTRDRSAPLTATVYDVASGGVEHVPFSMPANLSRTLEVAKEAGLWILGSSEHAEQDLAAIPRDRPWLLVLGNEERGLRQLTLKTCDELCRLTPRGPVGSLNVSTAAAVMIAALTGSGGAH